jgi:hypothetical protein
MHGELVPRRAAAGAGGGGRSNFLSEQVHLDTLALEMLWLSCPLEPMLMVQPSRELQLLRAK